MAAPCAHFRLPILLAVSLLAGVAGDEWFHRWLPHSSARQQAVREQKPPEVTTGSPAVHGPAAGPDDLATSHLP